MHWGWQWYQVRECLGLDSVADLSIYGYYEFQMRLKLKDIRAASRGDTAGADENQYPL
jgi:hypothetical protein